jgi:hypothetical protein
MNMKKILYITLSLIFLMGASSCEKWLDVNVDPDNPNDAAQHRRSGCHGYSTTYMYAWGTANTRSSYIAGIMTYVSSSSANSRLAAWNPLQSSCTTIYQNWFLGAAVNLKPLMEKAEAAGAYHYLGAAYCIKSMGFLLMLDIYGEMPYNEALTGKYNPAYDQGDVIYSGCMTDLDKAIEYFSMPRKPDSRSC